MRRLPKIQPQPKRPSSGRNEEPTTSPCTWRRSPSRSACSRPRARTQRSGRVPGLRHTKLPCKVALVDAKPRAELRDRQLVEGVAHVWLAVARATLPERRRGHTSHKESRSDKSSSLRPKAQPSQVFGGGWWHLFVRRQSTTILIFPSFFLTNKTPRRPA